MNNKIRLIVVIILVIIMIFIISTFIKKQNVNIIYPSVVHIECRNDKTISSGSGIVYDIKKGKQYIVTNYHIVKGYSKIYVQDEDLNEEQAILLNFNEEADVAILYINNKLNTKKAQFKYNSILSKGDNVYVLTSALDKNKTYIIKNALISDFEEEIEFDNLKFKVIKLSYNIESGDSGSPVIDKTGKVIGMVTLKDKEVLNYGYALYINNVLNEIKNLEKKNNKINLGAIMTNSSNTKLLEEYDIKVPAIEGVTILSVKKNYPLDISKIKKGDIIVKFNNIEIKNVDDLKNELEKLAKNAIVNIEYYRDSELKKTMIKLN